MILFQKLEMNNYDFVYRYQKYEKLQERRCPDSSHLEFHDFYRYLDFIIAIVRLR